MASQALKESSSENGMEQKDYFHKLAFHFEKTLALWLEPAKSETHLLGSQWQTIRAVSEMV